MLDPKIKINGRTQGATIENLGFWGYGSILFWLAKNKIDCIAPELRFSMEVPRVAPLILLWPSPVKINGQSCLRNEKSQKSMVFSPRPPSIFNIKLLKNSHVHWFWFAGHPAYIDFCITYLQGPSITSIFLENHLRVHRFQNFLIQRCIDFCGKPHDGSSIWWVPHPKVHRFWRYCGFIFSGFIDLKISPSQGPSIFVENQLRVHRFENFLIPRYIDFCGKPVQGSSTWGVPNPK